MRALTFLSLSLSLAAVAGVAHAHPLVDEGRQAYEQAEFVPALDAFARAEAADDLTRDELVALFETRALVHLAMGNEQPMRADLARLAALAPDHALDRRAPPEVRRAFAEERTRNPARLRLRASPVAAATGVSVHAEVENDTTGLVRQVRVGGRPSAREAWDMASDAPLLVTAGSDGTVEYFAEAVGPGGVVLAAQGSRADPLRFAASGSNSTAAEGGGDEVWPWVVLTVVAVLLVAGGAVVTGVVLSEESSSGPTQVQPFSVRF